MTWMIWIAIAAGYAYYTWTLGRIAWRAPGARATLRARARVIQFRSRAASAPDDRPATFGGADQSRAAAAPHR